MDEGVAALLKELITEVKTMKTEIAEIKSAAPAEEFKPTVNDDLNARPYKVMQIASITPDEGSSEGGVRKTYIGRGTTFKDKKSASEYFDKLTKSNPGGQYELIPV